tara:strand:- start:302 stop:652 length:351 start_codon:yes stop_codon:yes gene_type:complete
MDKEPYLEFDSEDTKLEFDHHLEFEFAEEMEEMFHSDSPFLPNLIVDMALKNLDTTTQEIPVISIYTKDEDLVYDIIIGREDLVETLEVNLEAMEDFEDYERCQKITDAIYYLNNK